MQITKRKVLPIIFLILLLPMTMQITPVKAASWGVQEGAIYSYAFVSVLDDAGLNTVVLSDYSQDGKTWGATTGDIWEWEITSLASNEITGIFRASGSNPIVDDFICYDQDNIIPTAVPVTPFFRLVDWVAEGVDFSAHGPGMPETYFYQYTDPIPSTYTWSMDINSNHGYLVTFMFNSVVYGGTQQMWLMFSDYTAPDDNPNYDPPTTTAIPTGTQTGTLTTTVPAVDLGAFIDELFGGGQTIAGIPTGFFWLLLLLGIILLILVMRRNKKRGSKSGKRGKQRSLGSYLQFWR